MSGIKIVLVDLRRGERRLAEQLLAVSDRHVKEAEVHHVARDIARWSREHVRRIEDALGSAAPVWERMADGLHSLKESVVSAVEPHETDPLSLLVDLRKIYLAASSNSLGWEALAQVAQATRDADMLELASSCHPQTLRQIRWANTMIKTLSPQVLSSL